MRLGPLLHSDESEKLIFRPLEDSSLDALQKELQEWFEHQNIDYNDLNFLVESESVNQAWRQLERISDEHLKNFSNDRAISKDPQLLEKLKILIIKKLFYGFIRWRNTGQSFPIPTAMFLPFLKAFSTKRSLNPKIFKGKIAIKIYLILESPNSTIEVSVPLSDENNFSEVYPGDERIHQFLGPLGFKMLLAIFKQCECHNRKGYFNISFNKLLDDLGYARSNSGYHTSKNKERIKRMLELFNIVEWRGSISLKNNGVRGPTQYSGAITRIQSEFKNESLKQGRILNNLKASQAGLQTEELAEMLSLTRHTVSKYLEILRAEGKIHFRKIGRSRLWKDISTTIDIRMLTIDDLEAILDIAERIKQVGNMVDSERMEFLKETATFHLERGDPLMNLGAELDGKLVGFVLAETGLWEFGSGERTGWIKVLGVDPDKSHFTGA
ncbi:MAG: HTH domain-containing protein [Candidatus Glassbacteria bacterium]